MDKYPITYRCDMCGEEDHIVHTVRIKATVEEWSVCFCRKCQRKVMDAAAKEVLLINARLEEARRGNAT